jgi:hypothetical protein
VGRRRGTRRPARTSHGSGAWHAFDGSILVVGPVAGGRCHASRADPARSSHRRAEWDAILTIRCRDGTSRDDHDRRLVVASLSFDDPAVAAAAAKIGILAGSLPARVLGYAVRSCKPAPIAAPPEELRRAATEVRTPMAPAFGRAHAVTRGAGKHRFRRSRGPRSHLSARLSMWSAGRRVGTVRARCAGKPGRQRLSTAPRSAHA